MTVLKFGRNCQKPTRFLRRISDISIWFKIWIIRVSHFISSLNFWCSENIFEVLHASLVQILKNQIFLSKIFFLLPPVNSETSWGQSNSLWNLFSHSLPTIIYNVGCEFNNYIFLFNSSCRGDFFLCLLDPISCPKIGLCLFWASTRPCWVYFSNLQRISVFHIGNLLLCVLNHEPNFVQYDVSQVPECI